MKTVIVLVKHGVPPNDFPEGEMAELFSSQARVRKIVGPEHAALERRIMELERKMRAWPRTARKDPFYTGSRELAVQLSKVTGCQVITGFNEFCGPSVEDALDHAIARGTQKVVVVTPTMTRGGEHAELDIPAAIKAARASS